MRKPSSDQIAQFCLYAFPCYWTFAVLFIVLVLWREGFIPDLIPVTLVSIAILAAAALLMKKYYWISLPMMALGIYISLQDDQHIGDINRYFGLYLILHYIVCGVYVYMHRKTEQRDDKQIAKRRNE